MNDNKAKNDTDFHKKIQEQIDKKIEEISKVGVQQTNIDYLGKLLDAKKDIVKTDHLEREDENMMYRGYDNYGRDSYGNYDNYGNYGGGRRRDSQGRFMEGGNYGRRYRGNDMIDDMAETYGTYMENRENGRYSGPETSKAFDYMLKSAKDFFKHLKDEASSQEEIEKIRRTAREISEM